MTSLTVTERAEPIGMLRGFRCVLFWFPITVSGQELVRSRARLEQWLG
jgi:hypothetical protein